MATLFVSMRFSKEAGMAINNIAMPPTEQKE
jgi:hypothetical protein